MTAEEADARFAALVAEHRRDRRPRLAPETRFFTFTPMTAVVVAYFVGILVGEFAPAKIFFAGIVLVPLMFVCRALLKRSGHDAS